MGAVLARRIGRWAGRSASSAEPTPTHLEGERTAGGAGWIEFKAADFFRTTGA